MVDISVVVITLAERDDIECLRALESGDFDDYEVIVRRDSGVSRARNEGVKEAAADKIVFLDDDAIPCEDYLSVASGTLEEHAAVAGRILHPRDDVISNFCDHYDHGEESRYVSRAIGANMAFRREVFERVGYFDENFEWGHEDYDFSERVLNEYPIFYDPAMKSTHPYADSVVDYWRKQYTFAPADVYRDEKKGKSVRSQLLSVAIGLVSPRSYLHNTFKATAVQSVGHLLRSANQARILLRKYRSQNTDSTF